MILYSAPSSYYSMIARLALLEAGAIFEIKKMDIHFAKDQLSTSYLAINPAMTVPAMTDGQRAWTDSREILKYAAGVAKEKWMDVDKALKPKIAKVIDEHYSLSIERLTIGKSMMRIPPLRVLFPKMLRKIIDQLENEIPSSQNPEAMQAKINLNRERLAYFTEGDRMEKLQVQREAIRKFINELPTPGVFLFGDKPSSADILVTVLFARLQMIGEYDLVPPSSPLVSWFERMQNRTSYKEADIWTRFHILRLLFRH